MQNVLLNLNITKENKLYNNKRNLKPIRVNSDLARHHRDLGNLADTTPHMIKKAKPSMASAAFKGHRVGRKASWF